MPSALRRSFLAVAALAALAVPAVATAAAAHIGHYHGGAVAFVVRHSEHGGAYVEEARYHAVGGFERALVHGDGSFETCARQRINSVLFRDTCIRGTFTTDTHASGTAAIYQGAHGHRASHPSDTHHWSASLG